MKLLYGFLIFPMRAACPIHLIILDLIIRIIFSVLYSYVFLHYAVFKKIRALYHVHVISIMRLGNYIMAPKFERLVKLLLSNSPAYVSIFYRMSWQVPWDFVCAAEQDNIENSPG
jgi:hypothetical protein